MSRPLPLRFVTSVADLHRMPASRAEVAVVGRSNVGKSSLLNALANRNGLAKVSKTPGRTQLLNLFEADAGAFVVDCPGYGYAAVPDRVRVRWQRLVEGYLLEREELVRVLALVDGAVGPTSLDVQLLEWLAANEVPVQVVATKEDKVKPSRRDARRRDLASGCGLAPSDVVWVSAAKGSGVDRLRDLVRAWLA